MHDHKDAMHGLAYRMLRDPRDRDEVVSDTFLKAVRVVADFRGDCAVDTWLWKICRNLCVDKLRCCMRHEFLPFDDAVWPQADQRSPDRPAGLEDAMEKLSPYHWALVRMRLAGYTIVELAELMDVKRSTLSGHYNDAVGQLRRHLGRDLGDCLIEEDDDDDA